jgi:transposase
MANIKEKEYNTIPTQLDEKFFEEFILPKLWQGKVGRKPKLPLFKIFNYILTVLYTGCQWKALAIDKGPDGKPEIHYSSIHRKFSGWSRGGSCMEVFYASLEKIQEEGKLDLGMLHGDGSNTVAKKGGDGIGYCGHKHQKGEKVVAIHDNNGNVLAPMTVSPVNESDMNLLPESLDDLTSTFRRLGTRPEKGTVLNLDSGFDSRANRKTIWNRGLTPNVKENPRNRKKPKRGRKRFFDTIGYKRRFVVERSFAWVDKFKRLLIRFERKKSLFLAFSLLAYAMINLRYFF